MNQVPTELQVSAGGVGFRRRDARIEVALISTGARPRWQLPKGIVGKNEREEDAAQREVREEAGITTELITLIEKIEYWYFAPRRDGRVRFHKHVNFLSAALRLRRYERPRSERSALGRDRRSAKDARFQERKECRRASAADD